MLRVPAFALAIRGGRHSLVLTWLAIVVVLVGGMFANFVEWGVLGAAAVGAVWVLRCVRLLRLMPLGPGGSGGPGGGGPAGVREPRRPRPRPPGGSLALAVPLEPPDDAVALA